MVTGVGGVGWGSLTFSAHVAERLQVLGKRRPPRRERGQEGDYESEDGGEAGPRRAGRRPHFREKLRRQQETMAHSSFSSHLGKVKGQGQERFKAWKKKQNSPSRLKASLSSDTVMKTNKNCSR